jgi:(p)ppGpp synthase/HD superfamily hydrolase
MQATVLAGGRMTVLTDRFTRAVDYARIAHAGQTRKGTDIPYLTHLLSVASLVIEFGGSEDQAIAGLLHDTIEDCGEEHQAIIREQFGDAVADIVVACTDGTAEGKGALVEAEAKKRDWLERKRAYLAHLAEAPNDVLLVSACDKLHNARAILADLEDPLVREAVFDRFTGGRDGTLQYYESLQRSFAYRSIGIATQLETAVARMHTIVGAPRLPLPVR